MGGRTKGRAVRWAVVAVFVGIAAVVWFGLEPAVFGENRTSLGRDARAAKPAPAFQPPPDPSPAQWKMPGLWQRDPPFPYLPGESRQKSRSIGGVVHGHLVNSVAIPRPHPALAFLEVQYQRKLFYTTDRMREIVVEAANHVRKFHPEAVLRLGNFGNPGGGDIPYSFSHNSGRDADLAFFVRNEKGEPGVPPDLVDLDANGEYDGEYGTFEFDAAKNWRLIEGLVRAAGDQLQYVFVSNPLRRDLLERARKVGAPAEIRRRARRVLHQPSGSLPHDDHFHVRIYCSAVDVESGCWDRGVEHPWYDSHRDARRRAVERARGALEADEPAVRARGARRLALLEADGARDALVARLEAPTAKVRAAAARSLGRLGIAEDELIERLDAEKEGRVYLETVDALSRIGGRRAAEALTGELKEGRTIELPGRFEADSRSFVADATIRIERREPVEALVGLLGADGAEVRTAAARALRYLTNHRFGDSWGGSEAERLKADRAEWREWLSEHGDEPRIAWLRSGFERAGYEVDRVNANHVWDLCRAIEDADHLSYNAQRALMRIADRHPESLSWPKEDASVFWRRWFERRRRRYGAPPIPGELSTLD